MMIGPTGVLLRVEGKGLKKLSSIQNRSGFLSLFFLSFFYFVRENNGDAAKNYYYYDSGSKFFSLRLFLRLKITSN